MLRIVTGVSPPVRSLLLALVATLAAVGAGVAVTDGEEAPDDVAPAATDPTTSPGTGTADTPATGTPLADFDTRTVAITRGAFCDAVPDDAVERALGRAATEATAYGDGQPARVTDGVRDVAHEYACTWTGGGVSARAWVFAPPVTPADARGLVAGARAEEGCEPQPDAAAYGAPTVALRCGTGREITLSHRGLFGDAWLSCSLAGPVPAAEAADRTGRWCVAVAQAAAATEPTGP